MTREEVAKVCGLENPTEYIRRTGKGRTTAAICDAVAAASEGKKVYIVAYRTRYAQQMADSARRMAHLCGIHKPLFDPRAFEWERKRRDAWHG